MNLDRARTRLDAAAAYDAAADQYDAPTLGFWVRHSERAVRLAALRPGDAVLDVGCGTGASALPAAAAVGPSGRVVALDVAPKVLERTAAKAAARGLTRLETRRCDMATLGEPGARFDVVIAVFSIFFVPDMARQVARLWNELRPGGRLVVAVWAADMGAPMASILTTVLRDIRHDLPLVERPWARLTEPANLAALMRDGGTTAPRIERADDRQPLASPEDGWTVAMGSGFRALIEPLTASERAWATGEMKRRMTAAAVHSIETSALHAVAVKPR